MKRLILLFSFLILNSVFIFSQSFDIRSINSSKFPIINSKFHIFDEFGVLKVDFTKDDFSITENGIIRDVISVSCPPILPPQNISAVLTIDISGSMNNDNRILMAKQAAITFCNKLPTPNSECAITSFDDFNYLNQDFTSYPTKLIDAINTLKPNKGTDYNQGLLELYAGSLQITQNAKFKRIIVFLTDGTSKKPTDEAAIISEAKKQNCTIYCVTLGMPCPDNLKNISNSTGGIWFENIYNMKDAQDVYLTILEDGQNNEPCEIEWQSDMYCNNTLVNTQITLKPKNLISNINYQTPPNAVISLKSYPGAYFFANSDLNVKKNAIISFVASNGDFDISDITSTNPRFTISPNKFTLKNGDSISLTISYTANDSNYQFTQFSFISSTCPANYYASAGFVGKKPSFTSLKLLKPNGGENFIAGSDTLISWAGVPPTDTVKIEYSTNKGKTWNIITNKATGLNYKWHRIPKSPSDSCLMRVQQYSTGTNGKSSESILYTLTGHTSDIYQATWSPDGKKILTASYDSTIRVWDGAIGKFIQAILPHQQLLYKIKWSPDGSKIAAITDDNQVKIWNSTAGYLLQTIPNDSAWEICWSPDNQYLACAGASNIAKIWDVVTGTLIDTLLGHTSSIMTINWSPDGTKIITGSKDKSAIIWDATNGSIIFQLIGHSNSILNVSFSPDNLRVVTTSSDKTGLIWDALKGIQIGRLDGHKNNVRNANWSLDSKFIASSSDDGTTNIYDLSNLAISNPKTVLLNSTNPSFSPDANSITTIFWNANTGNYAPIWDRLSGSELHKLNHNGTIHDVNWNPIDNRIVTASSDSTAKIWDAGGQVLQEDISDAIWKISIPNAKAQDVDLGGLYVDNVKDSAISNYLTNSGKYPIRIDSIYFTGIDSSQFEIASGNPPYFIEPNKSKDVEFRFKPTSSGFKNAKINIITQTDTLKQSITGVGLINELSIVSNFINFDSVRVNIQKDTLIKGILRYSGSFPLKITRIAFLGPNKKDFGFVSGSIDSSFTLNTGDNFDLSLKFKPSDLGRTSSQIAFYYKGVGSPAVVQLFGTGFQKGAVIQASLSKLDNLICENEKTDTLILNNIGSNILKIDSITIFGKNASDFVLMPVFFPNLISAKGKLKILYRFIPQNSGKKQANIFIKSSSISDSILILPISQTKDSIEIRSANNIYNLGFKCPGNQIDTTLILYNTGSTFNSFEILDYPGITFTPNKGNLMAGDSIKIKVKLITPNKLQLGYSEFIEIIEKNCNSINNKIIYQFDMIDSLKINSQKLILSYLCPNSILDTSIYINNLSLANTTLLLSSTPDIILPKEIQIQPNQKSNLLFQIRTGSAIGNYKGKIFFSCPNCNDFIDSVDIDYSIAKPKIITNNLNLGIICPNTIIDTNIFLNNTTPINVILNLKSDSTINLNKINSVSVVNNSIIKFQLNTPLSLGDYQSKIYFTDNSCYNINDSVTISYTIKNLNISQDTIIFNSISGNFDDQKLSITNTTSNILELTSIDSLVSPFSLINSNFPLIIKPDSTQNLVFRYKPTMVINSTKNLKLNCNTCNISKLITLIGNTANSRISIGISNAEGYPGDYISIPIYIKNSNNIDLSKSKFITDLTFNPSILSPLDYKIDSLNENLSSITLNTIPNAPLQDSTIVQIRFIIGLGNSIESKLSLSNFSDLNGNILIDTIYGRFKLLGVCTDGSNRLINSNSKKFQLLVNPNPVSNSISLSFEPLEYGLTRIFITDIAGNEVETLMNKEINKFGIVTLEYYTSNIPSGEYFISIESPTMKETKKIKIMK